MRNITMYNKKTPGIFPTMITPYKNGKIDYEAVDRLVEWYWRQGCDGIFATCQSSEIMFLSLEERVELTSAVIRKSGELARNDKTREPMTIVASGHISDSFEEQVKELNLIAAQKPDALILISNRMDIENTSDEKWIEDAQRLIDRLPSDMPLGIYECPKPYKRLLTDKMLEWCVSQKRFKFIKDTCCDADMIAHRIQICDKGGIGLYNANAQTLLQTFRSGAAGYCGVMANFHPQIYSWLAKNYTYSKYASVVQDFLGLAANIESYTYPCCAKYHLDRHEGIKMEYSARSADSALLTPYQKGCVDQLAEMSEYICKQLNI